MINQYRTNRRSLSSPRRRSNLSQHRRLTIQPLETRRLLAAEGLSTEISRQFNTTGLVGSLSSTVNWGDNTQTTGSVSGTVDNAGPLSIKFEYVGSFFNDPARRTLLQNAAASVIERFSDQLEAIRPTSFLKWTAVTSNPTTGQEMTIQDLSVAQNELVIYVGARALSSAGNRQVGEASIGFARTSYPGLYTQAQLDQINAWQETLQYRGQEGAKGANPTDIGPWGGSIAFDSNTKWHFGATTDGLDDDEVDFSTVVVHELMHNLGFGLEYVGSTNSSFETFSNGTSFTGPKSRALYGGNIPLANSQHLADEVTSNGQQSVVTPLVEKGVRKVITPLDVTTLDDIGWTVRNAPTATVSASHVYADNPESGTNYPVEVILRGSQFGELTQSLTTSVTNTPPVLTVASNRTIQLGDELVITDIGQITDPGFDSAAAGTTESFTYSIDWGDRTTDTGNATTDAAGGPGVPTRASFDGTHTYQTAGTYTVTAVATDDDGGSQSETFMVTVTPPPELSLTLSGNQVDEDDGVAATMLTVSRSGSITGALAVALTSSDTSEATVNASVTIPAGQRSVTVPVNAIDDTLFDSTQTVTFQANAPNAVAGEVDLQVFDVESISADFVGGNVLEAETGVVVLRVTRSNTDVDSPVTVNISGGNASRLTVPVQATIEQGQRSVDVPVTPVQNDQAELNLILDYVISSQGYVQASQPVALLDDDSPYFQHPLNRFNSDGSADTAGQPTITPNDILVVINELFQEGGDAQLNASVRTFEGLYYDVDGSGVLSPNDIKEVIDELVRLQESAATAGGEQIIDQAFAQSDVLSSPFSVNDDSDEERFLDSVGGTSLY